MTDEIILPEPVNQPEQAIGVQQAPRRFADVRLNLTVLLVIIIVAILGLIFAVVYDGVYHSSQDHTRKSDLSYIAAQAEDFYHFNGYYPTLKQFNSLSFFAFAPSGVITQNFKDPSSSENYMLLSSVSPRGYAYVPSPFGCDNTTTYCEHFKIIAILNNNQQYIVEK